LGKPDLVADATAGERGGKIVHLGEKPLTEQRHQERGGEKKKRDSQELLQTCGEDGMPCHHRGEKRREGVLLVKHVNKKSYCCPELKKDPK